MNILNEIIANKREEIAKLKTRKIIEGFSKTKNYNRKTISLKQSILDKGFGIIAEIKRKSPSGGNIKTDLNVEEQTSFYDKNGAAGISILTDDKYFGGNVIDIIGCRKATTLPILRKEFIIDILQLYESKIYGADAVLLIGAVLQPEEANYLTNVARNLGLEVLYEVHTREEVTYIPPEVDMVAVNNRDLKAQHTSLQHSFDLINILPKDVPLISASGIKTPEDIAKLKAAGYHGALIGESILREGHLAELTKNL
ncbi:indole-3-glycerol phosphate synthase TrpC [Flavobacterium rhizosphaerae]|uniref:indole-3-glycerol-phosphate synthase n=1 Tax=Flavobacterium rhizosphaerae TaxID=3163298 RepID=A0ABW8YV27_9FLAO